MGSLPVLKPHEVVARIEGLGFIEVRQRGSHKQFRHADGRTATVPFHRGQVISPVLLRKIARDIGMTAEDLLPLAASEMQISHSARRSLCNRYISP